MKILPKLEADKVERPSYFARWFEMVPPNKVIREDEYFWHTGQSLEPDYFTTDEKLDNYLATVDYSDSESHFDGRTSDDENVDTFAWSGLSLKLDLSDDEESDEVVIDEPVSSRRSSSSFTYLDLEDSGDLVALEMAEQTSDWSQMPPLFPKLTEVSMNREVSDWSKMPEVLPPLKDSLLQAPEFEKQISDWSVMPQLLPPLMTGHTSDWVQMPQNIVPANLMPQVSWEAHPPQTMMPKKSWLDPVDVEVPFHDECVDVQMQRNNSLTCGSDDENDCVQDSKESEEMVPLVPTTGMPVYYPAFTYTIPQSWEPSTAPSQHIHSRVPAFEPTSLVQFPFMALAATMF
jgi:hypothetical protein